MTGYILELEHAPENFAIGRDNFGWWYTSNAASEANSTRHTGFGTLYDALEHWIMNRDDPRDRPNPAIASSEPVRVPEFRELDDPVMISPFDFGPSTKSAAEKFTLFQRPAMDEEEKP